LFSSYWSWVALFFTIKFFIRRPVRAVVAVAAAVLLLLVAAEKQAAVLLVVADPRLLSGTS